LSHLESRLRYALAKDVVFEVALIQMSQLKEKVSLESILESLGGAPVTPTTPPRAFTPPPAPPEPVMIQLEPEPVARIETPEPIVVPLPVAPIPDASPVAPIRETEPVAPLVPPPPAAPTTAGAQAAWHAAVEKFAGERPLEADTIRAVQFHTCKADMLEVMLPVALEKKLFYLRSPRNLEILEQSLTEQLGRPLRLVFIVGDGRRPVEVAPLAAAVPAIPGKPAPPPPEMSQEAFLNDPVIQNALKIFEAKVVASART